MNLKMQKLFFPKVEMRKSLLERTYNGKYSVFKIINIDIGFSWPDKAFKCTVVNRKSQSLLGRSPEFRLTVPLNVSEIDWIEKENVCTLSYAYSLFQTHYFTYWYKIKYNLLAEGPGVARRKKLCLKRLFGPAVWPAIDDIYMKVLSYYIDIIYIGFKDTNKSFLKL